tara:strand:+ start:410 stop:1456 length:1047 start_codon:yes stop_codon:yes gene_type:complete
MYKDFSIPNELITYSKAIWLAIGKKMQEDSKIIVYGLGVDDPKAMYQTLSDFPTIFGPERCFDTPLSEDSLTGYGIGLAINGYKPIHVHQRTDFLLLCCNQLINIAAKIKYLSNGELNCPFVIRAITGRSWGQGSQHSQSFHSLFSNIPGLRVLTPSTPQDVYNTYLNVFDDKIPTIVIEHRMLYKTKSFVKVLNSVPEITKVSSGDNLTFCSVSHMTLEVQKVTEVLKDKGIFCDHFSLVNHSNLNLDSLLKSANKTKNIIFVDHGWLNSSIVHTMGFILREKGFKGKIKILGYADSPCPTSRELENYFYPTASSILKTTCQILELPIGDFDKLPISEELINFKGPF